MDFAHLTLSFAGSAALAIAALTPVMAQARPVKDVVLVHGAFADGAAGAVFTTN